MTGTGIEFDWKFFRQLSMFGIVFVSIVTLALYGCEERQKPIQPKYKQGDVVWLKPDSTRAVVVQWFSGQEQYEVHYYDRQHEARAIFVPQYGIYSIVTN